MISLKGNRILFCGKGGSGKSTIIALIAHALRKRRYQIIVVNGDTTNPKALARLIFQKKIIDEPKPLMDFFGGIDNIECPTKDPNKLTRLHDSTTLNDNKIDIINELSKNYYIEENGIYFLLVGNIEQYDRCDGPQQKVVRDFVAKGNWVTLVDMKGDLAQFGSWTPDSMDIILCILDPTQESIDMAKKVSKFCTDIGVQNYWFILNKVDTADLKSIIMQEIGELQTKVLGTVSYDPDLSERILKGDLTVSDNLYNDIEMVVKRLEVFTSYAESGEDTR